MTTSISSQDFLKSASNVAHHFGFTPLEKMREHPLLNTTESRTQYKVSAQERKTDALYGLLTSGMCSYFDQKINTIPGPSLFYSTEQVPRSGDLAISFQVINVKKSVAEALLIQTIRSLLNDLGYTQHVVRINSLGDTDSTTRYVRDLTNFLRKRLEEMPPSARELMKEHSLTALMHLIEKDHDLARKTPSPLEYLTDVSRKHFREIVEFLDMSETPFEIDPKLLGHHECYSDTLFAFDILDENREKLAVNPLLIRGGRYSAFVHKMNRSKIPAVGAVLVLKDKKVPTNIPTVRAKSIPSVYLVHLGFGPKVRSLLLIEELKREGISVRQNIMSDSLSEQLRHAEATDARYALILGHKEFMDGSIILRDLKLHNQECISLNTVSNHLKRLALVA
jgi:histidyl-tRNA synthetase